MTTAPAPQAPQPKPGEADPIVQLAILVGIIALSLNVGFYFLSDVYFDDRVKRLGAQELSRLSGARIDFAIFTIVVGAGVIAAALRPRHVAHGIAVVAGVGSLVAVPFAFNIGIVLATMLLLVAAAFEVLVWLSTQRRSRAAWAYLSSLSAVYGVVLFFGAPKLRGLVGVGLWIALIAPGLLWVAAGALRQIRDDYKSPAA